MLCLLRQHGMMVKHNHSTSLNCRITAGNDLNRCANIQRSALSKYLAVREPTSAHVSLVTNLQILATSSFLEDRPCFLGEFPSSLELVIECGYASYTVQLNISQQLLGLLLAGASTHPKQSLPLLQQAINSTFYLKPIPHTFGM